MVGTEDQVRRALTVGSRRPHRPGRRGGRPPDRNTPALEFYPPHRPRSGPAGVSDGRNCLPGGRPEAWPPGPTRCRRNAVPADARGRAPIQNISAGSWRPTVPSDNILGSGRPPAPCRRQRGNRSVVPRATDGRSCLSELINARSAAVAKLGNLSPHIVVRAQKPRLPVFISGEHRSNRCRSRWWTERLATPASRCCE